MSLADLSISVVAKGKLSQGGRTLLLFRDGGFRFLLAPFLFYQKLVDKFSALPSPQRVRVFKPLLVGVCVDLFQSIPSKSIADDGRRGGLIPSFCVVDLILTIDETFPLLDCLEPFPIRDELLSALIGIILLSTRSLTSEFPSLKVFRAPLLMLLLGVMTPPN